jgi:hypothetical protein
VTKAVFWFAILGTPKAVNASDAPC